MKTPTMIGVLLAAGVCLSDQPANNGTGGATARSTPVMIQLSDSQGVSEADALEARFRSSEESNAISLITTRVKAFIISLF